MAMSLPPGPSYIFRQLHRVVLPPAVVHLLFLFSRTQLLYSPPTPLLLLAYILSWPIAVTVLVQLHDYAVARHARKLAAVVPPTIDHNWPGALDVIKATFVADGASYIFDGGFRNSHKYGHTFNFRVMFEDRIFTSEPEYIKKLLVTDFPHYEKGPLLNEQLNTLLGVGVFNSDGDMWKFHRTMTRPFFSKDRIAHFDIFDRHAEDVLSKIATRMREGIPIDWQDLISRFTMDSATEFLFGKNVCSLDAPLPRPSSAPYPPSPSDTPIHPADRFVLAFGQALEATALRGRFLRAWPLREFWCDKVKRHLAAVDEFIDPIVSEALREKLTQAKDTQSADDVKDQVRDDDTLLAHLVKFTDDHKVIKDETLNILLAGRDTTSCTLTFAVYALAEHPAVLKRVREEVLRVVGPSRRPTCDNIRELKYTKAFINEVLRLYPPVPVNSKCSKEPMLWKNRTPGQPDWYVPSNSRVLYSVLVMHRRKDLWGPDALTFDPDRFLDERVQKYLVSNPFIFLPFNAGPRICLGQQFAYNEISFMLARLLQRFSAIRLRQDAHPASLPPPGVEWSEFAVDGHERVWMRSHLTAYAKNGLWVEMDEAVYE